MEFQPISEEQVEAWKKQHGKVLILNFPKQGGVVYLAEPENTKNFFHMAKRAVTYQNQDDTISAGEVILNECYLGGLGELLKIDKNTKIYFSMCLYCTNLMDALEGFFTVA